MIHTIDDLKQASEREVNACLEKINVVDDLHKYIAWLNSADGKVVSGTFELGKDKNARGLGLHPSALAKPGACPLKHYYDCTGEIESDEVFSPEKQLTFDIGTVCHAMLQTYLIDMYEDQFEAEVSLKSKKLLFNSKTDGRLSARDYRFLLEIKTVKQGSESAGWERIQRSPMKDNLRQLMTYMYIDNCPFGLLLYFCKNNAEMKEYPIIWNEELWGEIYKEVDPIVEAIRTNTPPTPKVGSHCRYCGYRNGCKPGKEFTDGVRAQRRAIRQPRVR